MVLKRCFQGAENVRERLQGALPPSQHGPGWSFPNFFSLSPVLLFLFSILGFWVRFCWNKGFQSKKKILKTTKLGHFLSSTYFDLRRHQSPFQSLPTLELNGITMNIKNIIFKTSFPKLTLSIFFRWEKLFFSYLRLNYGFILFIYYSILSSLW